MPKPDPESALARLAGSHLLTLQTAKRIAGILAERHDATVVEVSSFAWTVSLEEWTVTARLDEGEWGTYVVTKAEMIEAP